MGLWDILGVAFYVFLILVFAWLFLADVVAYLRVPHRSLIYRGIGALLLTIGAIGFLPPNSSGIFALMHAIGLILLVLNGRAIQTHLEHHGLTSRDHWLFRRP